MSLSVLPGKYLQIIRYDSENRDNILKSIVKKYKGMYSGLRIDAYGYTNKIVLIVIDYAENKITIAIYDGFNLKDLRENSINIVEPFDIIKALIPEEGYFEIYALGNNELNLIKNILTERALIENITQPYIVINIEEIFDRRNNHTVNLINKVDDNYSFEILSPHIIGKILAYSKDYSVKILVKQELQSFKLEDILKEFVKSVNIWAMNIRFDDNEIWAVKKDKDSFGIISMIKNKGYVKGRESISLIEKLMQDSKNIDRVIITFYHR